MAEVRKATKAEAHYRAGGPARHCGICTMFRPPHGCTSVQGEIQAADLCDYFERDKRRAAAAATKQAAHSEAARRLHKAAVVSDKALARLGRR